MQLAGRAWKLSNSYRFGFNGKENDNEVKGVGNQQDYGMRVYDPRIGKFLSVDPITAKYPELTPYQFASNRPIDGIDLDGLEFTEYVYPQQIIRRNMQGMSKKEAAAYYSRGNKIGAAAVGGAMVAGASFAFLTGASLYSLVTGATWLSVPSNQLIISSAAGFTFNLLNPDPGTHVDFPGAGDEVAETLNWALKTSRGKIVHFLMEKGAKFENGEGKWAQKLLDEGNNVIILAERSKDGLRTSDFIVNGKWMDLKEISDIKKTGVDDLSSALAKVITKSTGQGTGIILDVTKQAGATLEVAKRAASRYFGQGSSKDFIRVVGEGFDETFTRGEWLKNKKQ
ncbi:RHS repeat-associated core domain-containing protein [Chitinophaga terrae (ex Kim and Jung 2007)]|uniref:RHS repeat-associated core domain-containing protein n=1 Tax=Chitinophaga terrae (ex Kim and Jung 2007) TaxID=408074 RepID=A0A1H4AK13_9BACT|nr:RHS repeat-associated core domain-containing protein [Chitinophaga terrae (ex Kim and Jung 2007)]GEP89294.1 hypothetical protein CTE07_09390 [Chitinophaga terrae (ex Kim and Jung 2007)]SEA36118.1 RHS repeat-associated core domain-containing protein [Chitinophaga terrae (ex Kim and Jung 2007)]